ncbi:MAG: chemotaxis protein CheW [Candidatus Muiribacterium halophilum]|uniref:Chemotaxis protein CheW n=1 Tax=Muiribacterium halophilum TaxID=2053465 RepID=A0A2N5ZAC0_MUIH1|nr:MAG: chemotaxis protein CheW [Candidatus Muirbacterium halophilum]
MAKAKTTEITDNLDHLAGKYLTFYLEQEVYGIEILKVQEIIGMMKVTKFPKVPHFVRGVINLRGKVIPVIDLRQKFNMTGQEDTEKTCIIVTQIETEKVEMRQGILVDEVSEVIDIESANIEQRPDFGSSSNDDFVLGVGKINDKVIILIDVEKILSDNELISLGEAL